MSVPSSPDGLPDDATVAARVAAHEAEQAKHSERMEFIAPAFSKLPSSVEGKDLADIIGARWEVATHGTVELTLDEVEQIARRIAELNTMAMQGGAVITQAEYEGRIKAAEDLARSTLPAPAPVVAADPTEYQRKRLEAAKAGREKPPESPL